MEIKKLSIMIKIMVEKKYEKHVSYYETLKNKSHQWLFIKKITLTY